MTQINAPLAVVFGGSRGIGAACVTALMQQGFDVALTYVSNGDAANALARDAGAAHAPRSARAYAADVRDAAAVAASFATIERDFGRKPACVIANAGINVPPGPVAAFPAEAFRQLVEVNLVGAFNVLQHAALNLADGGSIIALSTSLVRHAAAGVGPYSATKAAVESLLRSMAKELAPRSIRVNGVAPGPVDTDLFNAGKTDEAKARSAAMSPFNRIGTDKEIADVVAFLASPAASWISGQMIQPNGGLV